MNRRLPSPAPSALRRYAAERGIRVRVISGEEVLELIPALAAREPTSGYLFYDCQTDDARLVLTVLAEAERFGALLLEELGYVGVLALDLLISSRRPHAVTIKEATAWVLLREMLSRPRS